MAPIGVYTLNTTSFDSEVSGAPVILSTGTVLSTNLLFAVIQAADVAGVVIASGTGTAEIVWAPYQPAMIGLTASNYSLAGGVTISAYTTSYALSY